MSQLLNLGVALGASKTNLAIGYRIEQLDGTVVTAFTTTNVTETSVPGTYIVSTAVSCPDAGGIIVWGISGDDYLVDIIDRASVTAIEIADAVLSRSVANVENTASLHSLAEIILAILESSAPSTTWTIKKTDGVTTFNTRTLTQDANALPVTGVS